MLSSDCPATSIREVTSLYFIRMTIRLFFFFAHSPRVRFIPHRQFEHVLDTRSTANIHTELKRTKIKGSRATVTELQRGSRRSVSKSAIRASAESTHRT